MNADIQIMVRTVHADRLSGLCHPEFLDTQSSPFMPKFHRIILARSQALEKSEGAPGTHCSHMREVSLVTCILSVTLSMH